MTASHLNDSADLLADPVAYTDEPRLHATLARLRSTAPVSLVNVPSYRPFWAVTKHADILAIERANDVFINAPRPVLMRTEYEEQQAQIGVRTLIHADDPEHQAMRSIGANWFRPKAMRALQGRVDDLAKTYVDKMRAAGGSCDFARDIAVDYPLFVIMSLLGLPEADFPRMLKLTQELVGADDPEMQRSGTPEEQMYALLEMFEYFNALTASRRENPTDDLASAIANARIDGEYMSDIDTVSYYVIVATAGHDTTSAAISGGMGALIEHPDQRQRLRDDPGLMSLAAEEMIRWTTPVKGFMRTATEDTSVRGVPIAAGESVLLSYVSANRDEDVFDEPFRFDVGRDPNQHLSFGHGVHFCMGAALARMEIRSIFAELLPRLESVDFDGEPELTATTFVGGHKHLPLRYSLR
ncbi:cytochrome [Mycolicibacter engbaekii]|uniref:Cytochrome n=1 Tax=Mycolicibacter engbaekii TaxID=188915 RepID=A0A1X1T9D8_9MYCO|nr:cytochrome P450 [Mycolicibacter engbaekii]ORV41201.1 cytochrome [Mycolicibacter engbaekii]